MENPLRKLTTLISPLLLPSVSYVVIYEVADEVSALCYFVLLLLSVTAGYGLMFLLSLHICPQ